MADRSPQPNKRVKLGADLRDIVSKKEYYMETDTLQRNFLSGTPFPHIHLHNFLNAEFAQEVRQELLQLPFSPRSNDLYNFSRGPDIWKVLENPSSPSPTKAISKLASVLSSGSFRAWLESVSDIRLHSDKPEITVQRYERGDHLLCHDDDLEVRRIAYILYFVDPAWTASDGGALDLFSSTPEGVPTTVTNSVVPAFNSLAFFKVSDVSHHQVAEVLSSLPGDRLSVAGWFFGPPLARRDINFKTDKVASEPLLTQPCMPPVPDEPSPRNGDGEAKGEGGAAKNGPNDQNSPFPATVLEVLQAWINPDLLRASSISQLHKHFAEECSVQIHRFLLPSVWETLQTELQNIGRDESQWSLQGPPNVQNYCRLQNAAASAAGDGSSSTTSIVRRVNFFLKSEAFAAFLSAVTDFSFSSVSSECRKFEAGCFTLVRDADSKEEGLDVVLTYTAPHAPANAEDEKGTLKISGSVVYLSGDEELLSVPPANNSLSLVVRDEGTMRFVKYIDHRMEGKRVDTSLVFGVVEGDSADNC